MKVGELLEWNGRVGLVMRVDWSEIVILFSGDPPFEYNFDLQWFEWAKKRKEITVARPDGTSF